MSAVNSLEKSLGDVFKNAPKLPSGGKKALVQYLPWINLGLGALMLWLAYDLYDKAHAVGKLYDYANSLYKAIGGTEIGKNRLTVLVWAAVALLAVQGVLYIAAFPGTRDRKKAGWNFMFYASLVNVIYGVVILFSDYGDVGTLLLSLVVSAVGLFLL